jgi:hypothetical protein
MLKEKLNGNYSPIMIDGDRGAKYLISSGRDILSPTTGTVDDINGDDITIKVNDGCEYFVILSNINSGVPKNTRVSDGVVIGKAKGDVSIKVKTGGYYKKTQKITPFWEGKGCDKKEKEKEEEDSGKERKKTKSEEAKNLGLSDPYGIAALPFKAIAGPLSYLKESEINKISENIERIKELLK